MAYILPSIAGAESPWTTRITTDKADGHLDLKRAQVGDAGAHQIEVHLDEVVFDVGGFGGGEDFFPVEGVLADDGVGVLLEVPALDVHGDESGGIFDEVFGSVVAVSDGGNLKLKFDEFGIEE